ncbi:O-antigen ligase family protein [Klebsiella aerogenes]|uniref:O-antigen ligase family protein n=1 Tax=Klebsiella aerogenes TaxID=548 RepID=UPI001F438061|nr:Wzy polymerase domain-containing protein [Klebsiella aerogenes]
MQTKSRTFGRRLLLTSEQENVARNILLAGLCGYWLFLLHVAWPNHGRTGIYLPYNLVAWGAALTLCALFWFFRPGKNRVILDHTTHWLGAGAILMSLPLLWSPSAETLHYAFPRMAGLWAGMIFWFTLRQCTFTATQKYALLYSLVIAGIVEAIIVLFELHAPLPWLPESWQLIVSKYGRYGTGVFQQVNVTASFLATTLAVALLLLGLRTASLPDARVELARLVILSIAVILMSAVITTVYSRVGWLGGILAVTGIYTLWSVRRFKLYGQRRGLTLLLPLAGIVFGILLLKIPVSMTLEIHDGSNQQRLLTLYHTIIYALQHPFLGYGAGTYEGYYQHYLAALPGGNPGREVMEHPHNELLYQFSEGGIVALTGALLWCGLYLRLWFRATSILQAGAMIAMLPLLLHTQVEFPLYYSVPHCLALLILLRLADREYRDTPAIKRRHPGRFAVQVIMLILALYGGTLSFQSFQAGVILDKFENDEFSPQQAERITTLNIPWILRSRYDLDLSLLRLVRFRALPDNASLNLFTQENAKLLTVYASPDMYNNQIAVFHYLDDRSAVNLWRNKARRMFPWKAEYQEQ